MNTIKHERLTELAEGLEEPTAEESRLLKTSERLKAEFDELKTYARSPNPNSMPVQLPVFCRV